MCVFTEPRKKAPESIACHRIFFFKFLSKFPFLNTKIATGFAKICNNVPINFIFLPSLLANARWKEHCAILLHNNQRFLFVIHQASGEKSFLSWYVVRPIHFTMTFFRIISNKIVVSRLLSHPPRGLRQCHHRKYHFSKKIKLQQSCAAPGAFYKSMRKCVTKTYFLTSLTDWHMNSLQCSNILFDFFHAFGVCCSPLSFSSASARSSLSTNYLS